MCAVTHRGVHRAADALCCLGRTLLESHSSHLQLKTQHAHIPDTYQPLKARPNNLGSVELLSYTFDCPHKFRGTPAARARPNGCLMTNRLYDRRLSTLASSAGAVRVRRGFRGRRRRPLNRSSTRESMPGC